MLFHVGGLLAETGHQSRSVIGGARGPTFGLQKVSISVESYCQVVPFTRHGIIICWTVIPPCDGSQPDAKPDGTRPLSERLSFQVVVAFTHSPIVQHESVGARLSAVRLDVPLRQ